MKNLFIGLVVLSIGFVACTDSIPTSGTVVDNTPVGKQTLSWTATLSGSVTSSAENYCGGAGAPYFSSVDLAMDGIVQHLGKSVGIGEQCSQVTGAGTGAFSNAWHLTAANGDVLEGTANGTFTFTNDASAVIPITGTYTITGGTGRFSDATGSGSVTASQTGYTTAAGTPATLTLTGTLSY